MSNFDTYAFLMMEQQSLKQRLAEIAVPMAAAWKKLTDEEKEEIKHLQTRITSELRWDVRKGAPK